MKTPLVLFTFLVAGAFVWSQATKSATVPSAQEADAAKNITLKGDFNSYRGVMQVLSCHCFDGGVLTTPTGETINVCFEKGELEKAQNADEKMACTRLQVTGKMITSTRESDPSGVCPGGTITYLKVKSFKCLN